MSSAAAVNSPAAELGGEVGRRRLHDLHADPEVRPRLGDGGRDGRQARVRGGRHREQLQRVRGLAALGRPLPSFFFQPASVSSLVAALASNATGAAALASNAHDPGGTSASARSRSPPSAPSTIACRSMAPRSALRTRASRSSGWLARRLSRTVASVVVGYLTLVARDPRPGRPQMAGGRPATPSTAPELNASAAAASSSKKSSSICSRYGAASAGVGVGVRASRPTALAPNGTSPPGAPSGRRGVRSAWVSSSSVERVRPGADRRLGERARREVRQRARPTGDAREAAAASSRARKPAMGVATVELDRLAGRARSR